MFRYVSPYFAIFCHVWLSLAIFCHILPFLAMFGHILPCWAVFGRVSHGQSSRHQVADLSLSAFQETSVLVGGENAALVLLHLTHLLQVVHTLSDFLCEEIRIEIRIFFRNFGEEFVFERTLLIFCSLGDQL